MFWWILKCKAASLRRLQSGMRGSFLVKKERFINYLPPIQCMDKDTRIKIKLYTLILRMSGSCQSKEKISI